jgi:AmmeMemoRadiSam system protein B
MLTADRPQLRPHVAPVRDPREPQFVYLVDQLGLSPAPRRLSLGEFHLLRWFDGSRTVRDIHQEAARQSGGDPLPLEPLTDLVRRLDEELYLESPRFRELASAPVRPPRHVGCYEGEPDALRRQLRALFTGPRGPGTPRNLKPDGALRAALVPHIDYPRGGSTYAWGFKEVYERTNASLFVVIGTSHYSDHRFTLTRKDFQTPLGVARTDQRYIDRLVRHYGDGLFDDELMAHLPEHSIELEVVFLQYLYETRRPIRIVPLVVGPFGDCVQAGAAPSGRSDIGRMIAALRAVEAELDEPVCYIISGDLAHLGPKFQDPEPVCPSLLEHSRNQDLSLLYRLEAGDPLGYFRVIAEEGDARRVCGLPPTYTLLEALRPRCGQLLHYDQYVHPRGQESVSFASVAFYR